MAQTNPEDGVTAHLMIPDGRAAEAIAFYEKAFGAAEVSRSVADDGKRLMHAYLTLNGGGIMMHDDFPEFREDGPAPAIGGVVLHLEVSDADAAWQRAIDAGAAVRFPLADQFWGARYGQVVDPFGHTWSIGMKLDEKAG